MTIRHITAMFRLATPSEVRDGIVWYANAQQQARTLATNYGLPLEVVVGVIAALSPNNKWDRNVTNAQDMIHAYLNGDDIDSFKVSTYHTMKRKAWSILEAGADQEPQPANDWVKVILNGRKIVAFFECIMGEDSCCIDGHARNIYYNERIGLTHDKTNIGVKEYATIAAAYSKAARALSKGGRTYHAYEVQAITWVVWRRVHNIK